LTKIMSGDEILVLALCGILAAVGWGRWYYHLIAATRIGSVVGDRLPLYVTPLFCGALLLAILNGYASHDVRDSDTYLSFYTVMGAAWLLLAVLVMPLLGVSPRLDALERRNRAATIAVAGAMIGVTFAFAGGNIGDGPGWWVVLFSSGLATLSLLVLWVLVAGNTSLTDHLTIDRDRASGVRFAALMVAAGAIMGRAVAGDWTTGPQMVQDFAVTAWPVLGLAALQIALERQVRPTARNPHPDVMLWGVLPGTFYLAVAVISLLGVGWW
jgi:uncharacterized membrane protein YjfL (UPF0719 family)